MALKSVDLYVLLKLALMRDEPWTIKRIADDLFLNLSDVHGSLKRCVEARLLEPGTRSVLRRNLEEFVLHGAKYAFAPERSGPTIGMPTAYAAPPLSEVIVHGAEIPVWPNPEGPRSGYAFEPLHKSTVRACRRDQKLYELLALVDAIRDGKVREVKIASEEISRRIRKR